jgi:D-glycero-D-manno-heptose 1,7-bisphosphate phosphatase
MLILLAGDGVLISTGTDGLGSGRGVPELRREAGESVRRLNDFGHRVAVLLDTAGPDGRPFDPDRLERRGADLREALLRWGARVDYMTGFEPPDESQTNDARAAGSVRAILRRFGVPPDEAILIADELGPLMAAAAAGCRRILVRSGRGAVTQSRGLPGSILPVAVHSDIAAAVDAVLGREP